MAHDYNGDATGITPATAITIHEPDDGDPDNVASVNPTVFERLANWVKWLFTFAVVSRNANGTDNFQNLGPIEIKGTNATAANSALKVVVSGTTVTGAAIEADTTGATLGATPVKATAGDNVAGLFTNNSSTVGALQGTNADANGGAVSATCAAAGHTGKAVKITDGVVSFDGGTAKSPAVGAALLNKISPKTIIKGWALVRTDGAGAITLVDGQNVSGASLVINAGWDVAKKVVQVDWAQGFASVDYGVEHFNQVAGAAGTGFIIMLTVMVSCTVAHAQVGFYDTGTSTKVDPGGPGGQACGVLIVALGAQ
jgi:hypothetical protein